MLKEALDKGVRYLQGEVDELVLHVDNSRGVSGVKLADGSVVEAEKVLLATGAWTSLLLSTTEKKLGMEKAERIEHQVKAAGVHVAHYALSPEEVTKWERMPVVVYGDNGGLDLLLALVLQTSSSFSPPSTFHVTSTHGIYYFVGKKHRRPTRLPFPCTDIRNCLKYFFLEAQSPGLVTECSVTRR